MMKKLFKSKTKLAYKNIKDIVQKTEIIYESNDDKLA